MKDLTAIEGLLEEIKYLRNKAALLDEIMRYWNSDTMTFDIPKEYKRSTKLSKEKLKQVPKSPRHVINRKIAELLPQEESCVFVNDDEFFRTAAE